MLKERTKVGLDAAREEGRSGGRRPKLTPQQQAEIRKMVSKGDKTAADTARLFKIHPATVSKLLTRSPQPSAMKVAMPNMLAALCQIILNVPLMAKAIQHLLLTFPSIMSSAWRHNLVFSVR